MEIIDSLLDLEHTEEHTWNLRSNITPNTVEGEMEEDIARKYEREIEQLKRRIKAKMIEKYKMYDEDKTLEENYLNNLLAHDHISTMGQPPEKFFRKLIKLYGVDKLIER